jgi:hypothetical protein
VSAVVSKWISSLHRWASRQNLRFSHRGAFLMLVGIYDVFYSLYLLANGSLQAVAGLSEYAWGIIWLTTGVVLILGSTIVWRKKRFDGVFFALAIGIKVAWAMQYFRLEQLRYPLEWIRGAYFLIFALIVLLASSWRD